MSIVSGASVELFPLAHTTVWGQCFSVVGDHLQNATTAYDATHSSIFSQTCQQGPGANSDIHANKNATHIDLQLQDIGW